MPATYKVQIKPVEENFERVINIVLEYLDPDSQSEAERLVAKGGTVIDNLNREAAEAIKTQLEEAGAEARVVSTDETEDDSQPDALNGRVRRIESREPVAEAKVVIQPATSEVDVTFGEATTSEDGTYTIERFGVMVREYFPERNPDLRITVMRDGQELRTRHKPFDWAAFAQGNYTFTIEAAAPQASEEDQMFTVSGQVMRSDSEPAAGVTVRAYDRDMRSRELLGETTTDETGRYEISYSREQFSRAEKGRADLVVQVFNEAGTELEAESEREETIFNAGPEERVDLRIVSDEPITLSEYERLIRELTPLLEGVALAELTEDDIEFLSRDTEREPVYIRILAQDASLSREHDVREAVFYGLARKGVGVVGATGAAHRMLDPEERGLRLELQAVLEADNATLREALEAAVAEHIIPFRLRDSIDDIIARLDSLRAEQRDRERARWPQHELTGRLLNEETGEPLTDYAIRATDLDAEPEPQDLGRDFTDGEGRFAFSYRTHPEASDQPRTIELTVRSSDGEEIATQEREIRPAQAEEVELRIALPEPSVPGDDVQVQDLQIERSGELDQLIEERGLTTLADVRALGGLNRIEGFENDESARRLQAHADLSVLAPDNDTRKTLIDKGFNGPIDIARTSRERFARSVGEEIADAGRVHNTAKSVEIGLNNRLMELRTRLANGLSLDSGVDMERLKPVLPEIDVCTCRDCESAVSPAAYLADLTRYVLDHVKKGDDDDITLSDLEDLFYQPFSDLPLSCEAVQQQVRQVRLCIEILLRHFGEDDIQFLRDPDSKGGKYRSQAYEFLLNQIGTSPQELRLAEAAGDEDRQSLADRLGIAVNHLDDLLLIPTSGAGYTIRSRAFWEENLEQLFGLRAFVYRGSAETRLERGTGLLRVVYPMELVDPLRDLDDPLLLRWQLEHLRRQWMQQDHLWDVYTEGKLPLIDPDVIGPDDFRTPDADESAAFEIWENRRDWVDERLTALQDIDDDTVPDIDAMFSGIMAKEVTYKHVDGTTQTTKKPWDADTFDEMLRKLESGTDAEDIRTAIENKLHLTVESFTRLVQLVRKVRQWKADSRYAEVTEDEKREIHSILAQAQKRSFHSAWVKEEQDQEILFGPKDFWISLREPQEGPWSVDLKGLHDQEEPEPFIDPEKINLKELPEPTAGEQAIKLWKERQGKLEKLRVDLRDELRQSGFDAMLGEVYESIPEPGDEEENYSDWPDYFQRRAIEKIVDDLSLSDEAAARKLKSVRAKATADADSPDNLAPPSPKELEDVFDILTTAWKDNKYPDWVDDEEGLTYWKARKARLSKWRASREDRKQWQQALRRRSERPIIDPDQLVPGEDLAEPMPGERAYDLWKQRDEAVTQDLNDARDIATGSQPDPDKFENLLNNYIGISRETLADVARREQNGERIQARIDQLTLDRQAFNYLRDVHNRIEREVSISESTWEGVVAIVVDVSKKRRFAEWQQEEGPSFLFDLDLEFGDELEASNLSQNFRDAFSGVPLSQNLTITTQKAGSRWQLHDEESG